MLKSLRRRFRERISSRQKGIPAPENASRQEFYYKLELNLQIFQELLENCVDVKYRYFQLGTQPSKAACVIYLDNMIDKKTLEDNVLAPLTGIKTVTIGREPDLLNSVEQQLVETVGVKTVTMLDEAMAVLLDGHGILLIDGINKVLGLSIKRLEIRSIEEAASETAVRGPRDAFVELLGINITLLRRRLKTHQLKMEKLQLGKLSKTDVVITYISGIADPEIVEEVKNRISKIEIDGVLESNYIAEFIEDSPWSPFPQINATERPDRVAAGLLEGQVAVLVDNTPFALLMPMTFPQFLHTAEDYYERSIYTSFTRLIRFIAVNIALLLPASYIAVVTFHQELLPTSLLISIAAGRERVPFPAFVEAILMEGTFEILREAGVRLPRPVGQATSIVGALVIGNAAVTAGLVSPLMVIVVSVTALASFIIPTTSGSFAIRLLRFPIMFCATALGFFGVMAALMVILIHLCSLRSFGVPYLAPISPLHLSGWKDIYLRVPWWMMLTRPRYFGIQDRKRQPLGQKPVPPRKGDENGP